MEIPVRLTTLSLCDESRSATERKHSEGQNDDAKSRSDRHSLPYLDLDLHGHANHYQSQ